MSKFDFDTFYDNCDIYFAVNKNIYTKAKADELFINKNDLPLERAKTSTGYIYYGIGYNIDHEKVSGYWLSGDPKGRHPIECWVYQIN